MAKLYAFRSVKLAFSNVNNFLEKGKIYLTTMQVLCHTRNIKLMRYIETQMLTTIKRKVSWNNIEEIKMEANIYLTMYQIKYNLF